MLLFLFLFESLCCYKGSNSVELIMFCTLGCPCIDKNFGPRPKSLINVVNTHKTNYGSYVKRPDPTVSEDSEVVCDAAFFQRNQLGKMEEIMSGISLINL